MEETLRSMEQGNLKIRVRSLENEKALKALSLEVVGLVRGPITLELL